MSIHGVGTVVALTFRASVNVPARFKNSKPVGAAFGLTPSQYQSGEVNRSGSISKCGDDMMRAMLYEAAHIGKLGPAGTKSWSKKKYFQLLIFVN